MTIYANLTSSFGYFYGANPQDAKLDFSRVFDFFTPYHHTVFENLSDHNKFKLFKGLDYFDLEFLDGLAWDLRNKYEMERKLEDAFIDGKIKEKILLDNYMLQPKKFGKDSKANNLYHEYLLLKKEILKDEDSRNDFLESVAEQLNEY